MVYPHGSWEVDDIGPLVKILLTVHSAKPYNNDRLHTGAGKMDKDLKLMTNALIEEMGRMEAWINKRFDRVDEHFDRIEQRLDSVQHEINTCKFRGRNIRYSS